MTNALAFDRLQTMYENQRDLQRGYNHGKEMEEFTDAEHVSEILMNWVSISKELGEALDEVGWKPWAKYPEGTLINREAFKGEMVDAWHFFMNLMLHVGMTPTELYRGYMRKQEINRQRQANGYDGRSSKCPGCRREYSDPGVSCRPSSPEVPSMGSWCDRDGWLVTNVA